MKTSILTSASDEALLANALCYENIRDFASIAFNIVSPADVYYYNWHIGCIAEHLHAVHDGDIRQLIINIPPRSMKSILITVAYPAWLLGRDPRNRIYTASYGISLARKHSKDTRLIMGSDWYKSVFPTTIIQDGSDTQTEFLTTQQGFRKATSVGGAIMGDGGDYLIADDLSKADEALSDTIREKVNTWYDQSFYPRRNNPMTARHIVVMQRLHSHDLTGHLLERGNWHLLKLPAIAHKKIQIEISGLKWSMEEGELLQPERLSQEELDKTRNQLGEYAFAGQYLQEPVPPGGAEFQIEWFQFYERLSSLKDFHVYIFVDPAGDKKKATSDYTAIMVWALGADKNYYLVDVVRDRLNTTERVNKIFELQKKYSINCGRPVKVFYKSRSFITELHNIKERQSIENYRFPIIEVMEKGEKNERIRRMIPAAQNKQFYLPRYFNFTDYMGKNRDLVHEFINQEVALFPVAAHDDMLDATSELFNEKHSGEINFPVLKTEKINNFPEPKSIYDL